MATNTSTSAVPSLLSCFSAFGVGRCCTGEELEATVDTPRAPPPPKASELPPRPRSFDSKIPRHYDGPLSNRSTASADADNDPEAARAEARIMEEYLRWRLNQRLPVFDKAGNSFQIRSSVEQEFQQWLRDNKINDIVKTSDPRTSAAATSAGLSAPSSNGSLRASSLSSDAPASTPPDHYAAKRLANQAAVTSPGRNSLGAGAGAGAGGAGQFQAMLVPLYIWKGRFRKQWHLRKYLIDNATFYEQKEGGYLKELFGLRGIRDIVPKKYPGVDFALEILVRERVGVIQPADEERTYLFATHHEHIYNQVIARLEAERHALGTQSAAAAAPAAAAEPHGTPTPAPAPAANSPGNPGSAH
eukprot:tig00001371_g8426.t1